MTSSTWISSSLAHLSACGLDAERIERFEALLTQPDPMPFVFSPKELSHCARQSDPAAAMCICFCAKEAVYKALGGPYDFTHCISRPDPDGIECPLELHQNICVEHGVLTNGRLEYRRSKNGAEIVAAAYLFKGEDDS